jgi:hypothetical protein
VRHAGVTRLVAVLAKADIPDWAQRGPRDLLELAARVSPDGRYVAFMSQRGLTGYDTRDASTGAPDEEVYVYHAPENLASQAGTLACASCDPSGARPVGEEGAKTTENGHIVGTEAWQGFTGGVAALVPGWDPYRQLKALYQPRYLSNDGRVFFDARDSLVSQAVNGTWDVYEYEPEGVGTCAGGAASGSEVYKPAHEFTAEQVSEDVQPVQGTEGAGCVALISSGESGQESAFLDASESGNEVFFMTTAKLVKEDTDNSYDVYDAHECTSESPCFPEPAAEPAACNTEASCKPAPEPQPGIYGPPASATFNGPGNATPEVATKANTPPCSSSAGAPSTKCTKKQNLTKALATCKRDKKKAKRKACEKSAKAKYGAVRKAKKPKKK